MLAVPGRARPAKLPRPAYASAAYNSTSCRSTRINPCAVLSHRYLASRGAAPYTAYQAEG
jgi:hypothetical protein